MERVAIEAIAQLEGVPEEARRLLLALAVGRERPERPEGTSGPLTPAQKMKRYRERRAASAAAAGNERDPMLPGVTEAVTVTVTEGVTVAAPPDPPEIPLSISDDLPSERGSETRVRAANVTGVTEAVTGPVTATVTRYTNATADGAGGLAVTAWAEGIRSVTKKPFMPPRGGSSELSKLVEALLVFGPGPEARVDWAREQGRRFAETNKGKLSAHSFVDWLNSPPPDAPKVADSEAAAKAERARADRQAERDREQRELERNRGAAPPEALEFARGRIPPKKGAA